MQQRGAAARPLEVNDLPLEVATVYPETDGWFGRRAKARRAKLLASVADVLRKALAPGETIRYAARGVRYSVFEHVFGGAAVTQFHNMTALVLTDRRLLLVQVNARGRPADIKNEVPLAAIRGAGRGWLGLFRLRLADGSKLSFSSIRGADKQRLEALLPAAGAAPAAAATPERSLVPLCPACLRPVPGEVGTTPVCPQQDCRIPFRDPRKAARLSTIVPGLGDLYLRHHLFGSLEFLGSMAALAIAVAVALEAAVAPEPETLAVAGLLLVALVAVPRVIDRRLTLHMGRKGLVPLALAPAPGAQVRNLPSYPRWSPLLFVAGVGGAAALVVGMSQDLPHRAALHEARTLAAAGRLDDARARWEALVGAGGADEARRVEFALALLEAGDLEGADELRASFEGTQIDGGLVDRWNAAAAREEAALADYREGVQALVAGDAAAAWPRVDRALAYFQGVVRPHLPRSRGEIGAHLAMSVLREPLGDGDLERAGPWLQALDGAPAAEVAAVRAAEASARGDRAATSAALEGLDDQALPLAFRLLALEARARVADGEAARSEVAKAARAFPRDELDEEDAARLDALLGAGR
jgi:hypothetical protein